MINTSLLLTVLAVRLWLCRQGALNPQPSLIDENLLDWLIVPLGSTTDGFVTVRLDEVWLFEKSLDASSMTRERPNCGNTLIKQHSRLIVELKTFLLIFQEGNQDWSHRITFSDGGLQI